MQTSPLFTVILTIVIGITIKRTEINMNYILLALSTFENWNRDQLKYDIIYPVLTLFQLQYKLTIRSQALLSANLYYIKFNNLQVSRLFP